MQASRDKWIVVVTPTAVSLRGKSRPDPKRSCWTSAGSSAMGGYPGRSRRSALSGRCAGSKRDYSQRREEELKMFRCGERGSCGSGRRFGFFGCSRSLRPCSRAGACDQSDQVEESDRARKGMRLDESSAQRYRAAGDTHNTISRDVSQFPSCRHSPRIIGSTEHNEWRNRIATGASPGFRALSRLSSRGGLCF